MASNSLSVIIPAFNELAGLQGTYNSVAKALATASISDYEILLMTVTDPNGKHDGTPDLAAKIASENPNVRHFPTPFLLVLDINIEKPLMLRPRTMLCGFLVMILPKKVRF